MRTAPNLLVLAALVASFSAQVMATDLGIKETQFTLSGAPTFLLGISYYGALGAPDDFIRRDLDDLQHHGFNWIRVWATWATFDHNVSAVEADGSPREPFLTKLKNLVAECDRRGLIVDVTLSRGKGEDGMPNLPTLEAHRRAVETVVTALKPYRNWYLDLGNERNVRDQRFVSFAELKQLRDDVKRLDSRRLVTASQGDSDINRDDLRDYLLKVQVDFLTPHRPRHAEALTQTKKITEDYLKAANELGRVVPVHYQEPLRIGWTKWQPKAKDFVTDLSGARAGGAAGWCFHNGNQVGRSDGNPRRSFDLREQRLFDQLDEEERKVLAALLVRTNQSSQATPQAPSTAAAKGPLRVHPTNPRYFTDGTKAPDGSLKAVYLTGSHTWNNQQDIEGFRVGRSPDPLTGKFDFDRYLDFLESYHHNFYRHWILEFAWESSTRYNFTVELHPWARTGPGQARDGKPKFDLSKFDPHYFKRLHSRVTAASDRRIYVAIMLFESSFGESAWPGHPFHPDNNVNGVDGGSMVRFHTLEAPAVLRLQEAYVRQVVDTVNDLDNVLYEICNEPGQEAKQWGDYLCKYIKDYQTAKPKQHPVGMTAFFDKTQWSKYKTWLARNELLFNGPYDWIAPGGWPQDPQAQANVWAKDPPANDGRKVIFPDPDHIWPVAPQRGWVWKCFARGHQPILMDWYDCKPGWPSSEISSEEQEAMRQAMGHTRRYADRMNLAAMTPRDDVASTQYCLANPGKEYLIYLPDGGAVTVDLSQGKGIFAVEWFNPRTGTVTNGGPVEGGAKAALKTPFEGDAVVYLLTKEGEKR